MFKTKDELELILEVKNHGKNADSALKNLIDRHSGIYLNTINSCVPRTSRETNKTDLIDDKDFNIYRFALDFNPKKRTKFSTYLCDRTKWMCYNIHNKNVKNKIYSTEEIDGDFKSNYNCVEDYIEKENFKKTLNFIDSYPDKRVTKIFKLRYLEGKKNKMMPWRNVSKKLDMSIQGCINIHNKTLEEMKNFLTKD